MINKLISIIIIVYNTKEEYLRRALESVLNQTIRDIEIILVNDGSDKNTTDICKEYSTKDKRIKLINQSNMGESVARNVGIENSTTEYITFLDSDDWLEPNMCEDLIKYINEINADFDIIVFNSFVNINKKQYKNEFYCKNGLLNKNDIEDLQLQNIEKGISKYYPSKVNVSVVWSKVYNKNFIIENNLKFIPNVVRMPDAIFNMYALEKAEKIYVLNKYLYHYRINRYSITQKFSINTINYFETYIEYVKKYIIEYKKNKKFEDILNIKIFTSIDNYMTNYFFHNDNNKNRKTLKSEFINLLDKPLYKDAINKIKKERLSLYQRLVLKYVIKKNFFVLKILKKIKSIIKSLI